MNVDWSEIKVSTSLSNSLLEYPPREGIAGETIIPDEKSRNKAILLLRKKRKKKCCM